MSMENDKSLKICQEIGYGLKSFQPGIDSIQFDPDHLTALIRHKITVEAFEDIGVVLRERSFSQVTVYAPTSVKNGPAITSYISHSVFHQIEYTAIRKSSK